MNDAGEFPGEPHDAGALHPGASSQQWQTPAAYDQPAGEQAPHLQADAGVLGDLRVAVLFAAALAVLGAVLGLVWAAWSPPGPRAIALSPGVRQPDETEAFVAGDGRYLVLSVVVGVLAAVIAWRVGRHRGPVVLTALALGCVTGSLLMELVGHLTGGGTFAGAPNTLIAQLPLSLHMPGMRFLQAGVAVLVYGMIAAFAVRDDLGRPDPVRDRLLPVPAAPPSPFAASVGAAGHPQDGGGDGDAAGPLQQRDLPAQ